MRAFLLYIDDWLSSKRIAQMDAHEEAGYLHLLLREATESDCGLPDDDTQLAILSGLGQQWFRPTKEKSKRIFATPNELGVMTSGEKIRQSFVAQDGRIFNERLLKEWNHQQEVQQKRAESGKLGGRPRKQTVSVEESKTKANGKQTIKQTESKTKETTFGLVLSSPDIESTTEQQNGSVAILDDFPRFRDACVMAGLSFSEPDMVSARFEWVKLDFEQRVLALRGLADRKREGEFDDPKYRPLVQNYLEKRIWYRAIRPRARDSPASSNADRVAEIVRERMSRNAEISEETEHRRLPGGR